MSEHFHCSGPDCNNCPCGFCSEPDCPCECHALDALSNDLLKQVLIKHGNYDFVDVAMLTRNQLFKLMHETDDPLTLVEHAADLLVKSQTQEMSDSDDDEMLDSIAQNIVRPSTPVKFKASTYSAARRTPIGKKTIKKQDSKATSKKKRPAAKTSKTAAQMKRERALARCAT